MAASGTRREVDGLRAVKRLWIHDGPAGFFVQSASPRHCREGLAGNEFSSKTVDYVIEAVLISLHDHFTRPALDRKIHQHQLLHAIEVPIIAGNHLEIPDQF